MTYVPRTMPRGHQIEAGRRLGERPTEPCPADVMAWLMEYGTGKSKVVIDEFGEREAKGDLHDILIIAGAGSYLNWVEDKNERQPSQFHAHGSDDLNARLLAVAWITGARVAHRKKLSEMMASRTAPRCLCMNIEALSSSKAARAMCREFLSVPGRRAMVVMDESTLIMTLDSNRTQEVIKLGGMAACRRLLTGLVVPNGALNLFSQFAFLDWRILGYQKFYDFRERYAIVKHTCMLPNEVLRGKFMAAAGFRGAENKLPDPVLRYKLKMVSPELGDQIVSRIEVLNRLKSLGGAMKRNRLIDAIGQMGGYVQTIPLIEGYQNLDELNAKISRYSYRVLKDDCLDLPPKIYAPLRDVPLTDEQGRIYRELRANATAALDAESYVTAEMVLTRNLRLQQLLCGYTVDDDGVERDVPSNRGADLMEVLAAHAGKAIIWCPFHRTLQRIVSALMAEYGAAAVAQFHGRNTNTRGDDERRFLGDPVCRFMVSTQATGGRGNTWIVASLVYYFANTYDLELRLNSEDRCHRDGLTHSVTYIDCVASGTDEGKMVQALRDKIDIATKISGDGYKKWII